MTSVRSRETPNKGTKTKVAQKWAEVLHHPCVLGGPQKRGQSQRRPTSGRKSYITPAFSGVPKQGDKGKGGPQVDKSATPPLHSLGSSNKGTKSKAAQKWAEVLHHPCVLGGPQPRGQRQSWPRSGRECYITPPFSGIPKQGDKVKGAPQVGGSATSPLRSRGFAKKGDIVKGGPQVDKSVTPPLRSRGSPNTGTKSKAAHPYVLGGPQTRGHSQRWPTSGPKLYIIAAFSGSPNKGTKSKVAHMWGEVLHHPCILEGPQTRGKSQRWPTSGGKWYITPAFSGISRQGEKCKAAPEVGASATSPMCSPGSPNKWETSMAAHKWAEVLHHPCVLRGPQTS